MEAHSAVRSLAALAQPTRITIFRLLVQAGPAGLAAGEIGAAIGIAAATLSFHLKELTQAGLITARPQSRHVYYSACYAQMTALLAYLTENCCARDAAAVTPGARCAPDECTPAKPMAASLARPKPSATRPSTRAKARPS